MEVFPDEEPQDAVSRLLSLFIEALPEEERYWTLFIPGLPIKARQAWEKFGRQMTEQMLKRKPEELPQELREMYPIAKNGGLTAADAVAVVVTAGMYGRFTADGTPISDMA